MSQHDAKRGIGLVGSRLMVDDALAMEGIGVDDGLVEGLKGLKGLKGLEGCGRGLMDETIEV